MNLLSTNNYGFIVIIFNNMFNYYGSNYKRIFKTNDVNQTLEFLLDAYIDPCDIIFQSKLCKDYVLAEKIIFYKLIDYQNEDSDFYDVDDNYAIDVIQSIIDRINDDTIYSSHEYLAIYSNFN